MKNFHDMLFNEPKAAPQSSAPPRRPMTIETPVGSPPPATAAPVTASGNVTDEAAYAHLLSVTDFSSTDAYAAIKKHLDPLATVALDDRTKFNIAVKEAVAQNGFDPAQIDATFERLAAALDGEATKFSAHADQVTATSVTAKNTQADNLGTQVQQLQAQIAQLKQIAFAAQLKIDGGKQRFQSALQTRGQELQQERAKYASLLTA